MEREITSGDASLLFLLASNPVDAELIKLWPYFEADAAKKVARAIVDVFKYYKDQDVFTIATEFLERTKNAPNRLKMAGGE